MATSRAYLSTSLLYESHKSAYIPNTMSHTRRTSGSPSYTSPTYRSTFTTGTSNNLGTVYRRYPATTQHSRPTTLDTSKYGTLSHKTTVHHVANPRPLPPGPGPQDELGRQMNIADTLRRTSNRPEGILRTGPIRGTHGTTRRADVLSPTASEGSTGSLLSRSRRTNSVSDLTAGMSSVEITSTNGSLSRVRDYGSRVDISVRAPTINKEKIEQLYDGRGTKVASVDRNYFSSQSGSCDYKNSEFESASSKGLPDINTRKQTTSREKSEEESPKMGRRLSYASRQGSNSSIGMSSTNNYSNYTTSEIKDSRRGLVGLKNLGNTCFLNSVIQCLSNTRLLLDYCLSEGYQDELNKSISKMKGSLMTAYGKLIKSLWRNGETALSPTDLKSQLQKYAPRFMGYNQQDSQEALIYLLEGLHEDVNRVRSKKTFKILNDNGEERISASEKARETWKKYLERDNSKVVDIFVGQLRSTLKCTSCQYESNTFDPVWDLSLPIKKGSSSSSSSTCLYDCFDWFTQEEVLDGDEKPTCARCKQRRRCTKSFSIQKFPKVLIIHLKRFEQGNFRKLSTPIDFPLTELDLTKYSAEKSAAQVLYNLYAVSNHCGTPYSGHYTAYCKHPYSGEWHHYNDARVTPIPAIRTQSSEAYVLFYELASQLSRL